MNAKMNFIGNITHEPATRKVGEQNVVSISVAVSTSNKQADGTYATDFYDVDIWGKRGETVMAKCQKGTQVYVEGDFFTRSYKDKEGKDRISLHLTANDCMPLNRLKDGATAAKTAAPAASASALPF